MIRTRSYCRFFSVLLLAVLSGCSKDPLVLTEGQTNWYKKSVCERKHYYGNPNANFNPFEVIAFFHRQAGNRLWQYNGEQGGDYFVRMREETSEPNTDWININPYPNTTPITYFVTDVVQRGSDSYYVSHLDYTANGNVFYTGDGGNTYTTIISGEFGKLLFYLRF